MFLLQHHCRLEEMTDLTNRLQLIEEGHTDLMENIDNVFV